MEYPIHTTLIKVDGVKSQEDLIRLDKLGVDIIGLSYNENEEDLLEATKTATKILKHSRLSLVIKTLTAQAVKKIKLIKPSFVELERPDLIIDEFIQELTEAGIEIIHSEITISHDDYFNWTDDTLSDSIANHFQINLLPEIKNPYRFLEEESPKYSDMIQVHDLNLLSNKHPMFFNLLTDLSSYQVVIRLFPEIHGVNFTVSDSQNEAKELFKMLEQINNLK